MPASGSQLKSSVATTGWGRAEPAASAARSSEFAGSAAVIPSDAVTAPAIWLVAEQLACVRVSASVSRKQAIVGSGNLDTGFSQANKSLRQCTCFLHLTRIHSVHPLAVPQSHSRYPTRDIYSPDSVFTLITSPWARYSGICTSSPPASVAGLVRLVTDPPFRAGAVSVISRSTDTGS